MLHSTAERKKEKWRKKGGGGGRGGESGRGTESRFPVEVQPTNIDCEKCNRRILLNYYMNNNNVEIV